MSRYQYKPVTRVIGTTNPPIQAQTTKTSQFANQLPKQSYNKNIVSTKTEPNKQEDYKQVRHYNYYEVPKKQPQRLQYNANSRTVVYHPAKEVQRKGQIGSSNFINQKYSQPQPQKPKKQEENFAFIQIYTKQALRNILVGKFNPAQSPLKNLAPKFNDILAEFNTNYSVERKRYENSINLETTIKMDVSSLLKQKYQRQKRTYFEMSQKTRLQKLLPVESYDQLKILLQEKQMANSKGAAETNQKQKGLLQIKNQLQQAKLQLQRQSKKKDQQNLGLNKEINNLKEQLRRQNQQLARQRQKSMTIQNQSYRPSEVNSLKESRMKLQKQLETAKEEVRTAKEEVRKVKNQQFLLQKTVQAKQHELKNTQSKNAEISTEVRTLTQKLEESNKIIKYVQQQKEKLKRQIQNNRIQSEKIQKPSILIDSSKHQIKNLNQQIRLRDFEIKSLKDQNDQNKRQIQRLNQQNKLLQQKQHKVSPSLQSGKLQKQISLLRQQVAQKDNQIRQKNQIIKTKTLQIQQLQQKEYQTQDELISARKQVQQIQEKLHNLQRQTQKNNRVGVSLLRTPKNDDKQRYQKKLKQKDQQINDLAHQIDVLNGLLQEKVQSGHDQSKIKQLESSNQKLKLQLRSKEQHYQEMQRNLQKKIRETLQNSSRQNTNASITIKDQQSQINQLKQKIKIFKQTKNSPPMQGSSQINMLYQHQLLDNNFEYKKFLTETIQNKRNLKILKTKLIFRYDPLNKVNFHRYIDGINNLVVIVKTKKGFYIAGYSESEFSQEKPSSGDGLLISLNNKKFFTLAQENRRAISYDDYYIIFGNSELRIRSLQDKVFSNFGISNSYFASKGEKVTVLLGQRDREVDLQSYQIYQIIFDSI